jgi:hypothetical protein
MESVRDENVWHSRLHASVTPSPMTGARRIELRMKSVTGRKGEKDPN